MAGSADADTAGWTPGDTAKARRLAEALGLAALLASLAGGSGGGEGPGIAQAIGDGYLNVVSRVLAGWDPDTAASELAGMLETAVADGAYAEGLAVTQITVAGGLAALEWYQANGAGLLRWAAVQDSRTCKACLDNAAADPRPAGIEWPSGDLCPPAHPGGCRCAIVPA